MNYTHYGFKLILFCILISLDCMAIDLVKCNEFLYGKNNGSDWYKVKRGLISITMEPIFTTQFVSSWGDCSAFAGTYKEQRRLFVAINIEQVQAEIAIGKGEFLNAYLQLRCIKSEPLKSAISKLQKGYSRLFRYEYSKSDEVYNQLEWELQEFGDCPEIKT